MKPQTAKKPIFEESHEKDTSHQSVTGALQDIGKDAANSVWEQFFKSMAKDASSQVLSTDIFAGEKPHEASKSEDMNEGQEILIKKAQKKAEHVSHHRMEYFKKEVDKDAAVEQRQETMIM